MKQAKAQPAQASSRLPSALFLLFAAAFVIRAILNMYVCMAPKMVIDEGLYTNIARSLAWEGKLAFRSQPVDYPYLLYPILLVPLYWLQSVLGGDIYRYVQLFNTLVMTSSVIPAFLFARAFSRDDQKAMLAAVLVAMMPDMTLAGYEITECILWPLALWMMYFGCLFFQSSRRKYGLLMALFTGFMFFTKPGAVAGGTVMLGIFALMNRKTDKKAAKNALVSLGLVLVIALAVYGFYLILFGGGSSPLGLYDKQTSEWRPGDILVAAEASLLMLFMFAFACGGIFFLLPLTHLKQYRESDGRFVLALFLGVAAVIVGTAVFVVPYKWTGELGALPTHMRYSAMYVPAFFIFAMGIDVPGKKISKGLLVALGIFIVLCLFPGVRLGFVKGTSNSVDSIQLGAFHSANRHDGTATGWIATIIMVVLSSFLLMSLKDGWKSSLKKLCMICYALLVLLNAVCANMNAHVIIDPTISADAREVNSLITGRDAVGVTQRKYDDIYSYWLDGRLNQPMQQITIDEMYVQMSKSGGVYRPFIPTQQAPNVRSHETNEADTLVLGITIAEHLELSDSVTAQPTANGHFTVASITPGEPWVDTMMYGMDDNNLVQDTTCRIRVFSENRNIDGKLLLTITASGAGTTLNVGGQKVALDDSRRSYDFELPFGQIIEIVAENGDAKVYSYTTQKAE